MASDQRKIVRNRQRMWIKYDEDHHWTAYKRQHNRYKNMLIYNKFKYLSDAILSVSGNLKALYQLTSNLTSTVKENPLPDGDQREIAEGLAEYYFHQHPLSASSPTLLFHVPPPLQSQSQT